MELERKLLNSNLAKKYGWKSKENILQKLKETFNLIIVHKLINFI